jgi:hypothetical protein
MGSRIFRVGSVKCASVGITQFKNGSSTFETPVPVNGLWLIISVKTH